MRNMERISVFLPEIMKVCPQKPGEPLPMGEGGDLKIQVPWDQVVTHNLSISPASRISLRIPNVEHLLAGWSHCPLDFLYSTTVFHSSLQSVLSPSSSSIFLGQIRATFSIFKFLTSQLDNISLYLKTPLLSLALCSWLSFHKLVPFLSAFQINFLEVHFTCLVIIPNLLHSSTCNSPQLLLTTDCRTSALETCNGSQLNNWSTLN